jgi:WD40 repeat protein
VFLNLLTSRRWAKELFSYYLKRRKTLAYERILAHPSRSEAISLTGNGVLTRWMLEKNPLRLAQVVTEFDRTWTDLAVSPTGEEFYLVNKTDRVERRRWADLAVVGEILCPPGTEPHHVAVSPDGLSIAVSGFGVGDYLLDATTGQIKNVLSGEPGLSICFSPNGRWLACAENGQSGGTLSLYEIEADGRLRGRYALKAFEPSTYSLVNPVFSPDSQRIVVYQTDDFIYSEDPSGWFGNILLFAVEAGEGQWLAELASPDLAAELVERSEEERLLDPTNPFFGNGEIVCGLPGGKLAFFSATDGERTREIQVDAEIPVTFVAIDSSLQALWVALDSGEVRSVAVTPSLDVLPPSPPASRPSLEAVREIDGHSRSISKLAYSLDGTRLVTLSTDQTVRVWDTATGQEMLSLPIGMEAFPLDVAQDGVSDRVLCEYDDDVRPDAVSPDGALLAKIDDSIFGAKIWDALTGQELHRISGHADSVSCIAFSPDGKHMATGSWDRTVRIWQIPS